MSLQVQVQVQVQETEAKETDKPSYIRGVCRKSLHSARLHSGVQKVEYKARRRKNVALRSKLRQAERMADYLDLDLNQWLTEVVPLSDVDVVEPSIDLTVDQYGNGVGDGTGVDGPPVPWSSALPLLRVKYRDASEADARLLDKLLGTADSPVVLSSEVPVKYLMLPLLFNSAKLLIFVSASAVRRDTFLNCVNTRQRATDLQGSYGMRWTHQAKNIDAYIPFANASYNLSRAHVEDIRQRLWKDLPHGMADLVNRDFAAALCISYRDFLSVTFQYFLTLLERPIHQLILDWSPLFGDITLSHADSLSRRPELIVMLSSAPIVTKCNYAAPNAQSVYVASRPEGIRWLQAGMDQNNISSVLCIAAQQHAHGSYATSTTMEQGLLCTTILDPLPPHACEYLSTTVDYEACDPARIHVLLVDCVPISTARMLQEIALRYSFPSLDSLKTIIRVAFPAAVLETVHRVLLHHVKKILYGQLLARLLSAEVASEGDHCALNYGRIKMQLEFISGVTVCPFDEEFCMMVALELAPCYSVSVRALSHDSYIYKLFGVMSQASAERRYPVFKYVSQACDIEGSKERFSISTLLCLLRETCPSNIPLEQIALEEHLAAIHTAETQIVCRPCMGDTYQSIIFRKVNTRDRVNPTTVIQTYTKDAISRLAHCLDDLFAEISTNYSDQFRRDVYLAYCSRVDDTSNSAAIDALRQRFALVREHLGPDYSPTACLLSLLCDTSVSTYCPILMQTLVDYSEGTQHPDTETLAQVLTCLERFFKRLPASGNVIAEP